MHGTCTLTFQLSAAIPGPVYVYYELGNYYQNHRRYVQSRSMPQLMGKKISGTQIDQCAPITTNADIDPVSLNSICETPDSTPENPQYYPLDLKATAYPCGLIAKSVFNDTFSMTYNDGLVVPFNKDNIAWKSDVKKFKNQEGSSTDPESAYCKQW